MRNKAIQGCRVFGNGKPTWNLLARVHPTLCILSIHLPTHVWTYAVWTHYCSLVSRPGRLAFFFSSTRSELTLTRPREKHARIHGSGTQCGIWDRGDFLTQTPSTIIIQRGRSVFVPKSSGQRDSSLRRKQSRTAHTTKTAEFILSRRFLEVQEIV